MKIKSLIFIALLLALPPAFSNNDWSYLGKTGPTFWGKLNPKYMKCRAGRAQSPINIIGGIEIKKEPVRFEYLYNAGEIYNDTLGLQINSQYGSFVTIGKERYELIHTRIRTPSEHQVDSKHYRMEIQLMHIHTEGKRKGKFGLILTTFISPGRKHNELEKILQTAPRKRGANLFKTPLNMINLVPATANRSYFSYTGSLTYPDCHEEVKWVIFQKPLYASFEQIKRFEKLTGKNNRPIQPLNGRVITK
tara:strand:- start:8760 stop:9506 length:747 start_codon:yes stop_codon:yes gene_type:complete